MMYGPLMMGLNGPHLNFVEKRLVTFPFISGVVLFQRNFQSQAQIKDLIHTLQAIRQDCHLPPWLIAIDHEGGSVQRLKGDGFTDLPSANDVAHIFSQQPEAGKLLLKAIATVTAYELGSVGIDLCLGPVLDFEISSKNENPNSRCYGSDPHLIASMTHQLITEMQNKGLTCVVKHFPGSSSIASDPHHFVSLSKVSYDYLLQQDLIPYLTLCKDPLLKAVMLSHLVYVQIDDKPIPLSTKWIHTILREQLGFQGAVFTDCLQMLGACLTGKNLKDKIFNVLQNGCDVALVTQIEGNLYQELHTVCQDEALCRLIHSPSSILRQERIKLLHKVHSSPDYEKQLLTPDYFQARETIQTMTLTSLTSNQPELHFMGSLPVRKKRKSFKQGVIYQTLRPLAKISSIRKIASFVIKTYYHLKLSFFKF